MSIRSPARIPYIRLFGTIAQFSSLTCCSIRQPKFSNDDSDNDGYDGYETFIREAGFNAYRLSGMMVSVE